MMQPFYQPRGEDLQISVLTREFTFPTHLHAHVELAHAFSGPLAMWIDGQTWALGPGDTAIAFAHCAHAYLGGGEGLMLIFPPEISLDFGRALQTARCAQPVLRARDAHSDIPAMMRATLVEIQGEGARSKAALRAYIQVILARLLPALDMEKESTEARERPALRHNALPGRAFRPASVAGRALPRVGRQQIPPFAPVFRAAGHEFPLVSQHAARGTRAAFAHRHRRAHHANLLRMRL